MNASGFALQLRVLTTILLLDLFLSISSNNRRCLSPVQYIANASVPRFSGHSAACWGHLKLCPLCASFLLLFLGEIGRRSFLGADLPMAAPTSAAEVKPLPQAAATGGAEPRATHPEKSAKGAGMGEHGERG